jgi:hypothetical protein
MTLRNIITTAAIVTLAAPLHSQDVPEDLKQILPSFKTGGYRPKITYDILKLPGKTEPAGTWLETPVKPALLGCLIDPDVEHYWEAVGGEEHSGNFGLGVAFHQGAANGILEALLELEAMYEAIIDGRATQICKGDRTSCARALAGYFNTLVLLSEVLPAEWGRPEDIRHIRKVLLNIKKTTSDWSK